MTAWHPLRWCRDGEGDAARLPLQNKDGQGGGESKLKLLSEGDVVHFVHLEGGGGQETGKVKRSSLALVATAECALNKSVCTCVVFFVCLQSGRRRERQDVKKSAVSESEEAELRV